MRFGKTWTHGSDSRDPFGSISPKRSPGCSRGRGEAGAALVPQHLEAARGGARRDFCSLRTRLSPLFWLLSFSPSKT